MLGTYVKQTIKIEGRVVTLITDGRELKREFSTPEEAGQIYDRFKKEIEFSAKRGFGTL